MSRNFDKPPLVHFLPNCLDIELHSLLMRGKPLCRILLNDIEFW